MTIPHVWHNIGSEVTLRVPLGPQIAFLTATGTKCKPCYDLATTRKARRGDFGHQSGLAEQSIFDLTSALGCQEG